MDDFFDELTSWTGNEEKSKEPQPPKKPKKLSWMSKLKIWSIDYPHDFHVSPVLENMIDQLICKQKELVIKMCNGGKEISFQNIYGHSEMRVKNEDIIQFFRWSDIRFYPNQVSNSFRVDNLIISKESRIKICELFLNYDIIYDFKSRRFRYERNSDTIHLFPPDDLRVLFYKFINKMR